MYSLTWGDRVSGVTCMIRVRRKKDSMKTPSTWSTLSWIERVIMYGGPIFILWILYQIMYG